MVSFFAAWICNRKSVKKFCIVNRVTIKLQMPQINGQNYNYAGQRRFKRRDGWVYFNTRRFLSFFLFCSKARVIG